MLTVNRTAACLLVLRALCIRKLHVLQHTLMDSKFKGVPLCLYCIKAQAQKCSVIPYSVREKRQ